MIQSKFEKAFMMYKSQIYEILIQLPRITKSELQLE